MPDGGGIRGLFAVSIVHGIVAPRAVGAAAQRDTAGNGNGSVVVCQRLNAS